MRVITTKWYWLTVLVTILLGMDRCFSDYGCIIAVSHIQPENYIIHFRIVMAVSDDQKSIS